MAHDLLSVLFGSKIIFVEGKIKNLIGQNISNIMHFAIQKCRSTAT